MRSMFRKISLMLFGGTIIFSSCGSPQTLTQKLGGQDYFIVEAEEIGETFDECVFNVQEGIDEELPPEVYSESYSYSPLEEEENVDVEDGGDLEEDNFWVSFKDQKVTVTGFGETFYSGTWREVGPNLIEVNVEGVPFVLEVTKIENDRLRFRLAKHPLNEKCALEVGSFSQASLSNMRTILLGKPLKDADAENEGDLFIRYKDKPGGGCSGTLLRNEWVLTSRHCITVSGTEADQNLLDKNQIEIQMGAQVGEVEDLVPSSTLDVALIRLKEPFRMDRATEGYRREFFLQDESELIGKELACFGYGSDLPRNGSPLGKLHSAKLTVESASDRNLNFRRGANLQALTYGDSGGSCRYYGNIAGIHEQARVDLTQGTDLNAGRFRDWALDKIGDAMTGPAVLSRSDGVRIYEIRSDNKIYQEKAGDGKPAQPFGLPPERGFVGDPTVVSIGEDGPIEVYARTKKFIYRNLLERGKIKWTGWTPVSPLKSGSSSLVDSSPAAAKDEKGNAYLFARHSDGAIYVKMKNKNWESWKKLPGDQKFRSAPVATVKLGGEVYVFAVGLEDRKLWFGIYKDEEGKGIFQEDNWSGWKLSSEGSSSADLNTIASTPAAVADFQGKVHVFVRDMKFELWRRELGSKTPGPWMRIDSPFLAASAPGVGLNSQSKPEVYVRDFSGEIQKGILDEQEKWSWTSINN